MIIFKEKYYGESLFDVQRDIIECFDARFNPVVDGIPADKHGFALGVFKVTVDWCEDEQ